MAVEMLGRKLFHFSMLSCITFNLNLGRTLKLVLISRISNRNEFEIESHAKRKESRYRNDFNQTDIQLITDTSLDREI